MYTIQTLSFAYINQEEQLLNVDRTLYHIIVHRGLPMTMTTREW